MPATYLTMPSAPLHNLAFKTHHQRSHGAGDTCSCHAAGRPYTHSAASGAPPHAHKVALRARHAQGRRYRTTGIPPASHHSPDAVRRGRSKERPWAVLSGTPSCSRIVFARACLCKRTRTRSRGAHESGTALVAAGHQQKNTQPQ